MMKNSLRVALLAVLGVACATRAAGNPAGGETRIARWKDDRTAAFLLLFDDGCPSHWQVAIPEMAKRGLIGTFYLNPGKAEFTKFRGGWETNYWKLGMAYGVHTMTHKGVHSMEEAEHEIGDCAAIIRSIVPGNDGKLVSYGQPGVGEGHWQITSAQLDALLAKHRLITRGEIAGHMAVYHLKTTAELLAMADKAIANKSVEFIVFHGIERIEPNWSYQDFWAIKQSIFLPFLDGVKERAGRGDLWVTDHISAHQYAVERDAATVRVLEAGDRRISVELSTQADPQRYDHPLTLVTRVPPAWRRVAVTQGGRTVTVTAVDSAVRYEARPGTAPVSLEPAR